jgi:EAL domain-containing protein (putative c-di-GMP-specific phosphodiesterase class I)
VAEGIETEDQLARLKELKCEYGQGFLFHQPMSAESANVLIEASTPVAA